MKTKLGLRASCAHGVVYAASLVAFLAAALPAPATAKPTNTNQCIIDLGGIAVCEDLNSLGLPSDLGACCDGVRAMAKDRCECNPAIDALLGEEGTALYDLEAVCRSSQPFKWARVTPRAARSCDSLQSHDYGCGPNDMEMDAARLQGILNFQGYFEERVNAPMCLNTPDFVQDLGTVFEPDISLFVPYGIGTYQGIEYVAEYLGMAIKSLNHNFWFYDMNIDRTKRAALNVSADGSTWLQGATFAGNFLRGDLPYTDNYIEQQATFEGCGVKVSRFEVPATEGLRDWVETYVQAADLSERWGVRDICRYHTEFCADDPSTRQYASEEECVAYIGSLPLYTEACGVNRPLSGHSLPCKFKHHFMIPTNPALHCPHIGPLGAHDPNHALKCDDHYECSDPNQGATWPLVTKIGNNTPQSIRDIFAANNANYEDEPLGCAIETSDTTAGLAFSPPSQCGFLWPNEGLGRGESVESCNGLSKLVMQHDGNFVLYRRGVATWHTHSWGNSPAAAIMQGDGNLVVYDLEAKPLWNSQTWNAPGAFLAVQDDGNLVIYAQDHSVLWSSDTWER